MEDNMISHNLFHYATSELSQDAFFCWLLSYSSRDGKTLDYDMFSLSQKFLKEMLGKKDQLEYFVTDIRTQKIVLLNKGKGRLDIFLTIEKSINKEKLYLIIEDKVNSLEHHQIYPYYQAVLNEDRTLYNNDNLFISFVKSGYMNKWERNAVKKTKIFQKTNNKNFKYTILTLKDLYYLFQVTNDSILGYVKDYYQIIKENYEYQKTIYSNILKGNFTNIYDNEINAYLFFDSIYENLILDDFIWCGHVRKNSFECLTWNKRKLKTKSEDEVTTYLQLEVHRKKKKIRIMIRMNTNIEFDNMDLKTEINQNMMKNLNQNYIYKIIRNREGKSLGLGYIELVLDNWNHIKHTIFDFEQAYENSIVKRL